MPVPQPPLVAVGEGPHAQADPGAFDWWEGSSAVDGLRSVPSGQARPRVLSAARKEAAIINPWQC